jgi:hypothetical protein
MFPGGGAAAFALFFDGLIGLKGCWIARLLGKGLL